MATPIKYPLFKVGVNTNKILETLKPVLDSGWITEGSKVKQFESEFKCLTHGYSKEFLMVNSCTSALTLAIQAVIEPGDLVAVANTTCSATVHAVVQAGGIPVLIPASMEEFGLMCLDHLKFVFDSEESRNFKQIKAVVTVDWLCNSVDSRKIKALAGWDIPVIQDAAHSLFVDWSKAGDFVCWSFQAIKFLTAGDGGMIACPPSYEPTLRKQRWFGLSRDIPVEGQNIELMGSKFHPNDITATIALANKHEGVNRANDSAKLASYYSKSFENYQDLKFNFPVQYFIQAWAYPLVFKNKTKRDEARTKLAEIGVQSGPIHTSNYNHSLFANLSKTVCNYEGFGYGDYDLVQLNIPTGKWIDDSIAESIIDVLVNL